MVVRLLALRRGGMVGRMSPSSRTPFEDTSVPVERSQSQIRKLLQDSGALSVGFESTWGPDAPSCVVRFVWPLASERGNVEQAVRLDVTPLPPDQRHREDQRERQAWRGLAWYLDGTIKAAAFGLIRFEDVFLSFMEVDHGLTLGALVKQQIDRDGRLSLTRGVLELEDGSTS